MATMFKVLALLAVLLLPLGMPPAAAAAAPTADHHMVTAAPHCPDQAPAEQSNGGFVECTMACSAALPAAELGGERPLLLVCAPSEAAAVRILHGLHPDIVPPPPKRS